MISTDVLFKAFPSVSEQLAMVDEDWALLISLVGPATMPAPQTVEPYEALIRAIAAQHLDPRAGVHRLEQLITLFPNTPFPTQRDIVTAGLPVLEACGFNRAKASILLAIAMAAVDGVVPSRREAETMTDNALVRCMADLPGVGRWTVDMFLINSLGRMDVLPADDFRVCEGYRRLKRLDTTPTPKQMRVIGKKWAPFRSTATYYLVRCKEGLRARDAIARIQAAVRRPASAKHACVDFLPSARQSERATSLHVVPRFEPSVASDVR